MEHHTLTPVGDSVPRTGPSGHKTGVISDSRPGSLLINDDAYYEKRILREAHITRSAYYEKRILREAHERIYNYVRHNSHIYT